APQPHDPYASLRIPGYRWYILSTFTMTLAAQIQGVVVSWQIYDVTRDPLSLGMIGLAEALPYIGVALFAGHIADKQNRRTISIASLIVLVFCSVALLLLSLMASRRGGFGGSRGVWPFYGVIFLSGIARSFLQPARQALGGAEALLPVFADQILHAGPQGLGVLRAAPAAGATLMSIYLAHRRPFRHAGRALLNAVALFALCIIGFGLSRSFVLSLALLAVSGMADNVSVVVRSTLLQVLTPEHLLGRVSSVNAIFIGSSNELGAFESGVAARILGTVTSVVLGGFASLSVVGLVAGRVRSLRKLEAIERSPLSA